jgi:hypothetical protein
MSTPEANIGIFKNMLEDYQKKTQPAATTAKPSRSSRAATAEDVTKAVNDALAGMRANSARESYINKFAADVPESYRQHIPVTDDPEALKLGEQVARAHFKNDFSRIAAAATETGHLPAQLYDPVAIAAAAEAGGEPGLNNLTFRQNAAKILNQPAPTLKPADQAKVNAAAVGIDLSKMTPLQRLSWQLKNSGGKSAPSRQSSASPASGADRQSGIAESLGRLAKRRGGS